MVFCGAFAGFGALFLQYSGMISGMPGILCGRFQSAAKDGVFVGYEQAFGRFSFGFPGG
jgi:hypothetical protein